MDKEMNFFDLCAACGRAIGRGCKALWQVLERMVRLTYRYWWVVLTLMVLAVAAALYYTRPGNATYKMNAVAIINGPSIQQFEQAFAPLRTPNLLDSVSPVAQCMKKYHIYAFTTYRVIDCLDDKTADYVDFKGSSSATDTVRVQMDDRLCLQFRIKERNIRAVPEIEQVIMDYLNSNDAMQQSYRTYEANLREEAQFNHSQARKLDSLTTHYYFYSPSAMEPNAYVGTGVNFYGDRQVRLFLDKIYKHQQHLQQVDYKMQLATAPVVLENHFIADPKPVNGRMKVLIVYILLAWAGGCALAEIIDRRKAISAWLKQ